MDIRKLVNTIPFEFEIDSISYDEDPDCFKFDLVYNQGKNDDEDIYDIMTATLDFKKGSDILDTYYFEFKHYYGIGEATTEVSKEDLECIDKLLSCFLKEAE